MSSKSVTKCPEIVHGEVIGDRHNHFQGHVATITSTSDVNMVLEALLANNKIRRAKHNIVAYRVDSMTKGLIEDYDDDGEAKAGRRMLDLLQTLGQKNMMVVVTRWWTGTKIGADRFRHINNATKQVIVQAGLLRQ